MTYDIEENKKIKGWMSPEELQWLYERAKEMKTIVELGSYAGRSTYALCAGCPGRVIAVDDFSMCTKEDLDANVAMFVNLDIIKQDSAIASVPVDMVFIDADHSYEKVWADIKAWLPLTRKLICGHDYDEGWPGVIQAVDEVFGKPEVVGSIWYKFL